MQIKLEINPKEQRILERKIKTMPERVFKKHVGKSASKAMTPVTRDAKKLAPKDSGDYRKSLGKKRKTYSRTKTVWVGVGPRKNKPHAHLGHLIEFGHRIVVGGTAARKNGRLKGSAKNKANTGAGRVVGFVPPQPHIQPAFTRNRSKVLQIYREELKKGVIQEAKI